MINIDVKSAPTIGSAFLILIILTSIFLSHISFLWFLISHKGDEESVEEVGLNKEAVVAEG